MTNEIKELQMQEFSLANEKIDEIPSFIFSKVNQILSIANNLSILRISDLTLFNVCYNEMLRFELFFDFESILQLEKKINLVFVSKEEEIEKYSRQFEVKFLFLIFLKFYKDS